MKERGINVQNKVLVLTLLIQFIYICVYIYLRMSQFGIRIFYYRISIPKTNNCFVNLQNGVILKGLISNISNNVIFAKYLQELKHFTLLC